MPAPNIQTLYDFETQIETAWSTVFTAALATAGITCAVGQSRDSDIEVTPRAEIVFSLNGALTQRTTIGQGSPKIVPNAFQGTLVVSVVTTRETNASDHGAIRGLLRYLLSGANQIMTIGTLPYLQILEQLPNGSAPAINPEKNEDSTDMAYSVTFAIRDEAWPSTS